MASCSYRHPPIGISSQDGGAVLIEQPRANDNRVRNLAFPGAYWLARHFPCPELGAGIGRQSDVNFPLIAPIGSPQIERRDLQCGTLLLERAVGSPYFQLRRNGEVCQCTSVRVLFVIFARYSHRVRTELARDREICGLWPEKIVNY